LQVYNTNGKWFQIFKYTNGNIINAQNQKAMDVAGAKDNEGQNVLMWKLHNGNNQRWKILYVDEAGDKVAEGLDKDFGFHINRPFYI